jgi:hypothetical protein
MSTIDLIAVEHKRYLSSSRSRRKWLRYVQAVERLQALREGRPPRRAGGRRVHVRVGRDQARPGG